MEFILGVLFLTVVAPVWIVAHYVTRWRTAKTLSAEDEKVLAEVWASTDKMESRIRNLERILDTEHPEWREER